MTNYAARNNDSGRRDQVSARSARRDVVDDARRQNREREAQEQRELFFAARRTR